MARVRGFGELEATVMDRLWNRESAGGTSVREIFEELCTERNIAYTTVMSTMDNLHGKGWLTRSRNGKAYQYRPSLTREEHSAHLMREALTGGGRPDMILSHFVEQIDADESADLRAALRRLARRNARKSGPR